MNTIEFGKLPKELVTNYTFQDLFKLKPSERNSVLVYNKTLKKHEEKQIYRSYVAYLNVPEFNKDLEKSYMFSNKESDVPNLFQVFLAFAKDIDSRYNQMVVNWYEPGDYIQPHRDCTANMLSETSPILCINLNETNEQDSIRTLLLSGTEDQDEWQFKLKNNTFYILKDNINVRHSVDTGSKKRISITFRMMKEE